MTEAAATRARISGRQRAVIGAAGAARSASGGMLATALAVYVGRTGSPLAVGLLSTAFFVGMMVFAPLWGALGDATGRRRPLLVAASGLATLATLAYVVVDDVPAMVGLRGVYAAFAVGFGPLMLSLVSVLAGSARRGRAAAFYGGSVAAGDVVGQVAVGALLGALAPSGVYLVVAGVGVAATLAAARVSDPARTDGGGEEGRAGSGAPGDADGALSSPRELVAALRTNLVPGPDERAALRRGGLGWLYAALALRHAAVKGIGALVPVYLLVRVGVPEAALGLVLAVSPAAQVGVTPALGRAADARGRKLLVVGGIALSGVYGLGLALAAVPSSLALQLAVAVGAFVAIAAGFAAMEVGFVALVGDAVPERRVASFVGFHSTAAGFGGVVGPVAVGATATVAGYGTAFALAGLFALVAAVVVARTLDEPPRRTGVEPPGLGAVETATGLPRAARVADAVHEED